MDIYAVTFDGTPCKEYFYFSKKPLPIGAICKIVADNKTAYENNVMIRRMVPNIEDVIKRMGITLREITSYTVIKGPRRPDDEIDKVYFNKEKGTTVVIWKDGTKTIVRCQPNDTWDPEKGLAMCYVKRSLGNRGSFNEVFKKYCYPKEE